VLFFRVVVRDVPACYVALGALHSLYKPVPGKFKDYIAIPKLNGYQSLHTALIGPFGVPVEVQIRTRDMHRTAEYGIAVYWLYKTGDPESDELDKALKDGFTDEEITKAKSGWSQLFAQNRVQDQQLANRLLAHLDSGRTFLTWDKAFEARVLASTPADVRAALRKYLDPAKLTIVKAGDFAKATKAN